MLDQILNLIDLIWPFLLSIAPIVAVIARKINKANKETLEAVVAVTNVVDQAVEVFSKATEAINVKEDGSVDFDPEPLKLLPGEINDVKLAVAQVRKEVPEAVTAWKDVFKK